MLATGIDRLSLSVGRLAIATAAINLQITPNLPPRWNVAASVPSRGIPDAPLAASRVI